MKGRRKNLKRADIEMSELDLKNLANHFGQSNKVEGKSPKTITWHGEMLHNFIRYLERANREATLANLDMVLVRDFIVQEQERGLSPYSVQGKVRSLKAFSSWLFNESYPNDNILFTLKLPKAPENLVEPLTNEENR